MTMHFFLGTNGPYGFFSHLDDLIDYNRIRRVHILKGTPGSGKSTLMKKLAQARKPTFIEYFHCSSDPDSLDCILFPDIGAAVVDGTAPHVIEPKYPGAVDLYVNLAQFTDTEALAGERAKMDALLSANKMGFTLATPWIHAASLLDEASYKRIISTELIEKIKARGKSLSQREIPKRNRTATKPVKRFLSAVTTMGLVCRFDTVAASFERVIAIDDNYGLASLMLPDISAYAASMGYRTYECYHPLHPDRRIEHVLIPELKLAFITNSHYLPYPATATRHIRLDSYIPAEVIKSQRTSLRFIAKTRNACLAEAASHLSDGKLVHDEIEKLFGRYIDFDTINDISANLENSILAM